MRSSGGSVGDLDRVVDALFGCPAASLSSAELKERIPGVLAGVDRLQALLCDDVAEFDQRALARSDGQASTKAWLQAFGHLSGPAAHVRVRVAKLMRTLPTLGTAMRTGEVSLDHANQIRLLRDDVGDEPVAEVEDVLVDAAKEREPGFLAPLCARVRQWVAHRRDDKPDGEKAASKRGLTLSPMGDRLYLRGQLDPEAGALLRTTLDAFTTPPGDGDERTPAEHRHDAFAQALRTLLRSGRTPTVGGVHPHLAALVPFDLLRARRGSGAQDTGTPASAGSTGHDGTAHDGTASDGTAHSGTAHSGGSADGVRPGDAATPAPPASAGASGYAPDSPPGTAGGASDGRCAGGSTDGARDGSDRGCDGSSGAGSEGASGSASGDAVPGSRWEPAWLQHIGPIRDELAERLLCDCDLTRIVLDPTTGLPLDVGRAYRTTPPWIRKALWARDRSCRWPGCTAPVEWCDSHHLRPWKAANGPTAADNLLLLCRFHHMLVHEGHWRLLLDPDTGDVNVWRPDGRAYELNPSRPWISTMRRTDSPSRPP